MKYWIITYERVYGKRKYSQKLHFYAKSKTLSKIIIEKTKEYIKDNEDFSLIFAHEIDRGEYDEYSDDFFYKVEYDE